MQKSVVLQQKMYAVAKEAALIVFSMLLIAFLGKISFFTPFSPIPLALRPQLVILLAWMFGSRVAIGALILFCAGVCSNVPFLVTTAAFSKTLFGPTFGYVFSYFVVAYLAPRMREREMGITGSFMLLSLVIDLLGALGLSLYVGVAQGFTLGFFPFLIGDQLKAILFAKGRHFLAEQSAR
ncbi:MAG: biotin transporter BioY [Chlamydiia bacterium]